MRTQHNQSFQRDCYAVAEFNRYALKNMKRILFIIGLINIMLFPNLVLAQCFEYSPKVVSLSGIMVRETYPGRPNYESIASGDEAEIIWVLKLKDSVCVLAASEIDVKEDNEKEIQLVLEPEQYNMYRNFLGKYVTVSGTLFHSHTGHHHKHLLLNTNEIKGNA